MLKFSHLESSERLFLWKWLGIALALHLLAAFFSVGFYHPDEQFQILEFIAFKLGMTSAGNLPIEFSQHMRPWLQPAFAYLIVMPLQALGIISPFVWATFLRLFSSFLGWLTLVGFALLSYRWIRERVWRDWVIRLCALLWFLPALHARISSENWGGDFFWLGLVFLFLSVSDEIKERGSLKTCFVTGLLWGCAFQFRYQCGFMIVGASLWLLIFPRYELKRILAIASGVLALVALGALIDRWGYGDWYFAPYQYVRFNLIEGSKHFSASDLSPWWDFFRKSLTETWPPLGLILFLSFFLAWIRNLKHPLTWSTLPLVAVHTLIAHKELRFIFPVALAAPLLFIMGIRAKFQFRRVWFQLAGSTLLTVNCIALIPTTFMPAWSPALFYRKISDLVQQGAITQLHFVGEDPYVILGVPLKYYFPPSLSVMRDPSFSAIEAESKMAPVWLFHTRAEMPQESGSLQSHCRVEFSALPIWIHRFNFYGVMDRVTNWTLFKCTP